MSGRGPLVPRDAHRASAIYLVAVVQFVLIMGIAQAAYPGYSDVRNAISDLGAPSTSPFHLLFDASAILLGALGLSATYLIRTSLKPGRMRSGGLGVLGVAGLGAVLVGVFPEGSPDGLHTIVSGITFVASGICLLLLAAAMLRDTRWDGLRLYTAVSGLVTLGAVVALVRVGTGSAEFGLIERIVVGPILLWLAVISVHLLRIPAYDPVHAASPVS